MSSPYTVVGIELPPRDFGVVTMTDIVRYQGASGDMNPMHHDDDLARSAGFPMSFGVGMLNAGYLATYCTDIYGVDSVRRFKTRFFGLAWRGDRFTATGRVTQVLEDGAERRAEVALEMTNQQGIVLITGIAEFVI